MQLSRTDIIDILDPYVLNEEDEGIFEMRNDGVLVGRSVFINLPDDESGIRVLEDGHYSKHKYKLYKTVKDVVFYVYSNSKHLIF